MSRALLSSLVVVLVATAGCAVLAEPADPSRTPRPAPSAVVAALNKLAVDNSPSPDEYDRDLFGSDWLDLDGDGCDTKEETRARDMEDVQTKAGGCEVRSGTLDDPYTGRRITFTRSGRVEVQVDHVVALGQAWDAGADRWDRKTRERFANDPTNAQTVDASENMSKSDRSADEWLPPNTGYHCTYVGRQVEVKTAYRLSVTTAERNAMRSVLADCAR